MAIRIDVKEYCAECCDFEADVTKPERSTLYSEDFIGVKEIFRQTDTIVRCKYRNRCEAIKRFLEKQKEDK